MGPPASGADGANAPSTIMVAPERSTRQPAASPASFGAPSRKIGPWVSKTRRSRFTPSNKPPFRSGPHVGGFPPTADRLSLLRVSGREIAFVANLGIDAGTYPQKGDARTGCNRSGRQRQIPCRQAVGPRNATAKPTTRIYREPPATRKPAAGVRRGLGPKSGGSPVSIFPSSASRHEFASSSRCKLLRELQGLLGISAPDCRDHRLQRAHGSASTYTSAGFGPDAVRAREAG